MNASAESPDERADPRYLRVSLSTFVQPRVGYMDRIGAVCERWLEENPETPKEAARVQEMMAYARTEE